MNEYEKMAKVINQNVNKLLKEKDYIFIKRLYILIKRHFEKKEGE